MVKPTWKRRAGVATVGMLSVGATLVLEAEECDERFGTVCPAPLPGPATCAGTWRTVIFSANSPPHLVSTRNA